MAKKKTRVWNLYRPFKIPEYWLNDENNDTILDFCADQLRKFCPNLVRDLHKGCQCKVKLTNLKNGIKLEKVK